jgi:hypothetical protein
MIPCRFSSATEQFPLYVGEPAADVHPLEQQAAWLWRERQGSVPAEVLDSFRKLLVIAQENNVSFEELCVYAMGEVTKTDSGETGSDRRAEE